MLPIPGSPRFLLLSYGYERAHLMSSGRVSFDVDAGAQFVGDLTRLADDFEASVQLNQLEADIGRFISYDFAVTRSYLREVVRDVAFVRQIGDRLGEGDGGDETLLDRLLSFLDDLDLGLDPKKREEIERRAERDDISFVEARARIAAERLNGTLPNPDGLTQEQLALEVQFSYRQLAYEEAGIENWNPILGLAENDWNAQAAWDYYAEMHERNPEQFVWAGMAHLVGPSFYAGFQDVHVLRTALENNEITLDQFYAYVDDALLVGGGPGAWATQQGAERLLGVESPSELADELLFVETTFLDMQKQIFDDMVWQHELFEDYGLDTLLLAVDGATPELRPNERQRLRDAWSLIEDGRAEDGNAMLLFHEQNVTIQDDYSEIWDRSGTTQAMITFMSVIAQSPIEGHGGFFDEVIIGPSHDVPFFFDFVTPDPTANVANFEDRWEWIEGGMLPQYLDNLETSNPVQVAALAAPVSESSQELRFVPNFGPLSYTPTTGPNE